MQGLLMLRKHDALSGFTRRKRVARGDAHAAVAGRDEDNVGQAADDTDLEGDDGAAIEGERREVAGEASALALGLLGQGLVVAELEPRWRHGLVDVAAAPTCSRGPVARPGGQDR